MKNLTRFVIVSALFAAGSLPPLNSASAATTTGGVNWLDPLGYTKPAFFPLTVPAVSNEYYINFSGGSGTICSQVSPCGSLVSLSGKAGMNGGPAYVYVKGTTTQLSFPATFAGGVGSEIVVKPWPGDSTVTTINAAGGGSFNDAVTIAGSGVHHVIFDGGPDMLIRFVGSGVTSCQNAYTVVVKSNDVTLYRVRVNANGSCGPALGPGNGSGTVTGNFRFINSELYGASRYYGVYVGGGTGCAAGDTSFTNMEFRNSIFRDIDGRGIQIEPRADSSGLIIDGNAFHHIGANSSGNMNVSHAVALANACGGDVSSVRVSNNIGFTLSGGFVGFDYPSLIANNTVFDYANSGTPPTLSFHAITSTTDGQLGTVRNNILIDNSGASGINPTNRSSGWTASNNLCGTPASPCAGTSVQTGTAAATFLSSSTTSADFLKPLNTGSAINNGANLYGSGITTDYLGSVRPAIGVFEIGAIEYGSSDTTPPAAPTGLGVE